jgi:DNA repair protein RecO (recombination protein O)
MLQKTIGIVLHVLKYSDTSNIIEMYTEQLGRCSYIISVSRAKKSNVRAVLFQPLSIIEFEADYRSTVNLHRIKEAKIYFPFTSIPYDPYKSAIALFLAEFLYRAVREEIENQPLFAYLRHSIAWLDEQQGGYANFHLVFLMRLSRFLGLYPNLEGYQEGDYFDLQNACFVPMCPQQHSFFIEPADASRLMQFMRMNYETMHLFGMNRAGRARCLAIINEYYRLHLPDFPVLKSLAVLQDLFD